MSTVSLTTTVLLVNSATLTTLVALVNLTLNVVLETIVMPLPVPATVVVAPMPAANFPSPDASTMLALDASLMLTALREPSAHLNPSLVFSAILMVTVQESLLSVSTTSAKNANLTRNAALEPIVMPILDANLVVDPPLVATPP